ncbi:MAG: TIGR03960 family B12-binding radical SAM protein [Candidatus Omnitrophota bacterium]|jgi:radical SAM family uncharacterized protein
MEEFLLGLQKPARYIGQEWNVSKKDIDKAAVKFALSFPDMYELGMSNLGLRILYSLLNKIDDVVCERVFAPAGDMEKILRDNRLKLPSLESGKPLNEFDLLGFSLGYELGYTNVLNILDLAGISLKSKDRGKDDPLVIGGGPCVMNPEPMHEFFDLFVFGEGEDVVLEIIDLYRRRKDEFKSGRLGRLDLLKIFAAVSGVYVPILGVPQKVQKRFVADLDKAHFPDKWMVPYIQVTHDRITMEVMRGCSNRCRFCQARSQYFPLRLRKPQTILEQSKCLYSSSGYEEISLTGLSVSDHPGLGEILPEMVSFFKEKGVSLSLPSMKPKTSLGQVAELLASIKKSGLTFAPESASPKLREALGKDFNEDDFFKTLEGSFRAGYQHVKLYFMVGLPGEQEPDLDRILDFSARVSELSRKVSGRPAQVNVSINTLIPKPHTCFQWFAMLGLEQMKAKQDYLRGHLRNRRIKLSFHNRFMSFMEGVLSRGDRRLSSVILSAFKKGARFDGWDEHFDFQRWMDSFSECGIDPNEYLKEFSANKPLAWGFLDPGIDQDFLSAGYEDIKSIL